MKEEKLSQLIDQCLPQFKSLEAFRWVSGNENLITIEWRAKTIYDNKFARGNTKTEAVENLLKKLREEGLLDNK